MKELFRHVSSWLLLLGVAVSFFAFTNASDIYQKVQAALAEVNEYKYKSMYSMYITDYQDEEAIMEALNQIPGNIVALGNVFYLNGTGYYHEMEIVMKQEEKLVYPAEIVDKDGDVYIGKNWAYVCYESNGKRYVDIEGKPYRLAGIMSSDNTDILSNKIVILNAPELIEHMLENGVLNVECGSEVSDIEADVRSFCDENSERAYIDCSSIESRHIEVGSQNAEEEFYIIISLFSIVNCVVISEFWILRRRKEIIIRKLFGFTNQKLFFYIYNQILKIAAIAVGGVLLTEIIMKTAGIMEFSLELRRIVLAGIFVVVSSLVITAIPVKKASDFRIEDSREMI